MRLTSPPTLFERLVIAAFAIFVLASTFSVAGGSLAGGVVAVLFVAGAITTRRFPGLIELKWFYLAAASFVFCMFVTAQISNPGIDSLVHLRHEWLLVLVPAGVWLLSNGKVGRWMVGVFALGVGAISLYSIGQFFWGWHFLKPHYQLQQHALGYWIVGNFNGSVTFGIFYAVAGIFLLGYGVCSAWRETDTLGKWATSAGGVAIVAAILSNERGPTVAVIAGIVALALLLRSKRAVIGLAVALTIIAAVGLQSGVFARMSSLWTKELSMLHDQGRLFIWTHAFYVARDNPVVGVGPGNFREGYAEELPIDPPVFVSHGHAHSDFLNYAAESGFPQLVFFLGMWVAVLWYGWKAFRSTAISAESRRLALAALAGSICFLVTSLFDIPFGHSATRQMLMFVWGAGLGAYLTSRENSTA